MADQALTSATSSIASSRWASATSVLSVSFPRVQAVVGTLAGVVSVVGALLSLVQFVHPVNTGSLVATVKAADSRRSVTDATIEVLTSENAIVATLTPDATGRATQDLKEGVYIVRLSHPRYAAEVRRIEVRRRQTVALAVSLRSGSSSPVERALNGGVGAVRKALRF